MVPQSWPHLAEDVTTRGKAGKAWGKVGEAWGKVGEAWDKAGEAWGKCAEAWGKALGQVRQPVGLASATF